MAIALAEKIEDAVLRAFEDERSARDTLRQIVVGPSDDRQVILVWTVDEWDEYGMQEPEGAVARISNAAWFDALDAVESASTIETGGSRAAVLFDRYESSVRPPPLSHPDPAVNAAIEAQEAALRAQIQEALRLVAQRARLGALEARVIGLFEKNLGRSSSPELVAFYHPLGLGPLLPLMEKVPPHTLVYPFASLHPAGIALFYPESDGDALEGRRSGQGSGVVTDHRFDAMRYTRIDGQHIHLFPRGELTAYEYSAGHTSERQGLSREAIEAALVAHVSTRPELLFDPQRFPDPKDTAAVERFVELFIEGKLQFEARDLIRSMVEEHGPDSPSLILPRLPAEHPGRSQGYGVWAEQLARRGRYDEALAAARAVYPTWHYYYWETEVECLLDLGRYDELLSRAAVLESPTKGRHSGPAASRTAPYKAMALARLGKTDDALALLSPLIAKEENQHACQWALASALQAIDLARAEAALRRALQAGDGMVERGPRDFAECPTLLAILERRSALVRQRERLGAEADQRAVTWSRPKEKPKARAEAQRWLLSAESSEPNEPGPPEVQLGPHRYVAEQGIAVYQGSERMGEADAILGTDVDALCEVGVERSGRARGRVDPADNGPKPALLASSSREGAVVYELSQPARPSPTSAFSGGADGGGSGLCFHQGALWLAGGARVVAASLEDPRAPQLRASLRFLDEEANVHFDALWAVGELIVLKDRGAWFLHTPAGQPPALVARFDLDFTGFAAEGSTLHFVDGDKKRVWSVDVSDPAQPRLSGALALSRDDGAELELGNVVAQRMEGDELVIHTGSERYRFRRAPAPPPPGGDLRAKVAALRPQIQAAVEEALAEHHRAAPEFRAGSMVMEWHGDDTLRLSLDGPRSFVGIESGPVLDDPPRLELPLKPRVGAAALKGLLQWEEEEEGAAPPEPPPELSRDEQRALERARVFAWHETLTEVLRALPGRPAFEALASGRVFLLVQTQLLELARIAIDPGKPWRPFRPILDETKRRTLEEEIGDFRQTDRILRRARQDPAVRAEVFRLSQGGDWMAVKVALSLAKDDLDGALAALMVAAKQPALDDQVFPANEHIMHLLGEHQGRPEVKACLEEVAEKGGRTSRQFAALALGREDLLLPLIRETLREAAAHGHSIGANHRDDLLQALDGIQARIAELTPDLLAFVESFASGDTDLLGPIALALHRSGHPRLPKVIAAQAAGAKAEESRHQYRTGIASLDREELYQEHSLARAERAWTTEAFVARLEALRAAPDDRASLWLPDHPPEPFPASWTYFVRSAWQGLEAQGLTEWLGEALIQRATPEPAYAADRQLFLATLNQALAKNQLELGLRLLRAALASPEGTFDGTLNSDARPTTDAQVKRRLRATLIQTLVAWGFQRSQSGDRAGARQLCEAALREDPSDGQALFLDARLVWFEQSVEASIARAQESLDRTTDPGGRGRLLNLIGCAMDELKRWPEAIGWFEQAAQVQPEEGSYVANIAECHHKLGDQENAVKAARLARRRGSKAEIIAQILGAAEDEEEEEEEE